MEPDDSNMDKIFVAGMYYSTIFHYLKWLIAWEKTMYYLLEGYKKKKHRIILSVGKS